MTDRVVSPVYQGATRDDSHHSTLLSYKNYTLSPTIDNNGTIC